MSIFPRSSYVNSSSNFALSRFSNLVYNYIIDEFNFNKSLVILCIGTDRSTGDSLGPLVGHKLMPLIKDHSNIHLLGTLENPIHAQNLVKTIEDIKVNYDNPFIIAIDSSLGRQEKVGYLSIKNTPLRPGAGVNKDLPPIGDISITGIVNIGGLMEFMVLQSTRLSLVMSMADVISKSIYLSINRIAKRESEYVVER